MSTLYLTQSAWLATSAMAWKSTGSVLLVPGPIWKETFWVSTVFAPSTLTIATVSEPADCSAPGFDTGICRLIPPPVTCPVMPASSITRRAVFGLSGVPTNPLGPLPSAAHPAIPPQAVMRDKAENAINRWLRVVILWVNVMVSPCFPLPRLALGRNLKSGWPRPRSLQRTCHSTIGQVSPDSWPFPLVAGKVDATGSRQGCHGSRGCAACGGHCGRTTSSTPPRPLLSSARRRAELTSAQEPQAKACRRIATRYEKTARNSLAPIHFVCALQWIDARTSGH